MTETFTEPTHYPPEEGGHPRGWGMGPDYKMKPEMTPGTPAFYAAHAAKAKKKGWFKK